MTPYQNVRSASAMPNISLIIVKYDTIPKLPKCRPAENDGLIIVKYDTIPKLIKMEL